MHSGGHKEIKETSHNPDEHRPPLGSLAVRLSAGRHELWVRVALVNAVYMKSSQRAKRTEMHLVAGRGIQYLSLPLLSGGDCIKGSGIRELQTVLGYHFWQGLYESVGIFVISLVVVMNEPVNENMGQLASLVFQAQEWDVVNNITDWKQVNSHSHWFWHFLDPAT